MTIINETDYDIINWAGGRIVISNLRLKEVNFVCPSCSKKYEEDVAYCEICGSIINEDL